jgi:manganese oxidase
MEGVVGMKSRADVRGWGLRVLLVAILVLASGGAWVAGRASARDGRATSNASATGYDLGVAGKPQPTGQVREFQLVAKEATWEIAPGVAVPAITYNGQVPGPTIRVTEGDTLRVTLSNELAQATAIHWHGLHVPNAMDGVPPYTQPAIEPGQRFTYEFVASHAGTFMYHSHLNAVEQIDRGLYGALIIDPATTPPARFDKEFTMLLSAWDTTAMLATGHAMPGGGAMPGQTGGMGGMAMAYNYFTINGKAFPANEAWTVREGELLRVRIINISNLAHPMHLHGQDFTVVAKDGEPIRADLQQTMNTLSVDAGETYDIAFRIDSPGTWLFHCHELHHTENDGVEPGGLIQVIQTGTTAPAGTGTTPATSPTPMPSKMPGMGH